jgi:predicted ATPase
MRKIVLTGGPYTGKTTLFEGLKTAFPDASFIAEPARSVLQESTDPNLPNDPNKFCRACVSWLVASEAALSPDVQLTIQVRSLVDTVAYTRRDNCADSFSDLPDLIRAAAYDLALVCEPVGEYAKTPGRFEDAAGAVAIHELLVSAYQEFGIATEFIPPLEPAERLAYVSDLITR